jgi:AcrR family transcriptional regulator
VKRSHDGVEVGRKPRFSEDSFTKTALEIVSQDGPAGLTIAAVARRAKAPVGSVYHRFPSKDLLVAELWLQTVESFQEGFLKLLKEGQGREAAMYTPRWVRQYVNEARLLLLYRRDELMSDKWPEELAERAGRVAQELDRGIEQFTETCLGEVTDDNLQRAVFALIDVPFAAVRRHLQYGNVPPGIVDKLVQDTYASLIRKKK